MMIKELKIISVCSPHEGSKLSYCSTCKVLLCNNCIDRHKDNKHVTECSEEIAQRHHQLILENKNTFNSEMNEKLALAMRYKEGVSKYLDSVFRLFDRKVKSTLNSIKD